RDLRRGGRAVLQTITMPDERWASYRRDVDWMQTYVFPGTTIPSPGWLHSATRQAGLSVASVDEIGTSYAPTLRAWRSRFLARLPAVRALGFDDRFVRTWELYLAFSEAAFAEGTLGDVQMSLSRAGALGSP
ncbi:MAG: class I SAM-dependent methyltransferase, partial [Myxococcota bacterium]